MQTIHRMYHLKRIPTLIITKMKKKIHLRVIDCLNFAHDTLVKVTLAAKTLLTACARKLYV
jgi:hypothetical protein